MTKMEEWSTILWSDVVANIDKMATEMEGFSSRCKKVRALRSLKLKNRNLTPRVRMRPPDA